VIGDLCDSDEKNNFYIYMGEFSGIVEDCPERGACTEAVASAQKETALISLVRADATRKSTGARMKKRSQIRTVPCASLLDFSTCLAVQCRIAAFRFPPGRNLQIS
jgi:hypothetical protein